MLYIKAPLSPEYECLVERYCLRAIMNGDQATKNKLCRRPKVLGNPKFMPKTRNWTFFIA